LPIRERSLDGALKNVDKRHHPEQLEQFSADHGKTALCNSLPFPKKTWY
jgi:hypothetical protein